MSTGTRIPLAEALREAEAFRALFDGAYERWEVAGSVRRRKPDVGDIEHVVIPRVGDVLGGGMFTETGDRLLERLDDLLGHRLTKAIYPDGRTRWGDKYRGVLFNGRRHEVFTAQPATWGAILAIRTGPAEFSKAMVTRLLQGGVYRQQEGAVRHVSTGSIHPVPNEAEFFRICRTDYLEPEDRK